LGERWVISWVHGPAGCQGIKTFPEVRLIAAELLPRAHYETWCLASQGSVFVLFGFTTCEPVVMLFSKDRLGS